MRIYFPSKMIFSLFSVSSYRSLFNSKAQLPHVKVVEIADWTNGGSWVQAPFSTMNLYVGKLALYNRGLESSTGNSDN